MASTEQHSRWVHTHVFEDSLHLFWREHASAGAHVNMSSGAPSRELARCSVAMRVELPARGHLRLRADGPLLGAGLTVQLRLLLSAPAGAACAKWSAAAAPPGWSCGAPICLGLSRAGAQSARFVPLCWFGAVAQKKWARLTARASLFGDGGAETGGFDEIVFLAGASPVSFLVDDVMVMSSAPPPATLAFPPAPPALEVAGEPKPGWCEYLSSEYGRAPQHAASRGEQPAASIHSHGAVDGRGTQHSGSSESRSHGGKQARPSGSGDSSGGGGTPSFSHGSVARGEQHTHSSGASRHQAKPSDGGGASTRIANGGSSNKKTEPEDAQKKKKKKKKKGSDAADEQRPVHKAGTSRCATFPASVSHLCVPLRYLLSPLLALPVPSLYPPLRYRPPVTP